MFSNPFCEEIPRDVHPEPSVARLEAISSCPVTNCLGELIFECLLFLVSGACRDCLRAAIG